MTLYEAGLKPPHVLDFYEFSQKLSPFQGHRNLWWRLGGEWSHGVWLCLVSRRSKPLEQNLALVDLGFDFCFSWKWNQRGNHSQGCSRLERYLMCCQSEDLTSLFSALLYPTLVVQQIRSPFLSGSLLCP